MRVIVLVNRGGYKAGHHYFLPDEKAKELIKEGIAAPVEYQRETAVIPKDSIEWRSK